MYKLTRLISLLFVITSVTAGSAQSIWHLPDPDGNPVLFTKDSSFVYKHKSMDAMVMYAIDQDGLRNVLVTDCNESRWAFESGKPLNTSLSEFLWVGTNQVFFAIDSVWYLANEDFTEIEIYNDNRNLANDYLFLTIDEIYFDTWITAIERATGNRVLLFYNSGSRTFHRYQDLNGNDIRVFKWIYLDNGIEFNDIYFVGSVFNVVNEVWTTPGLYRIKIPNSPELLLELGERVQYHIDAFQWLGSYLIDYVESGVARIYDYNTPLDSLIDVTSTILNGEEVIYVRHIKTPFYDEDNIPISLFETLWKTRSPTGTIKYILRDRGSGSQWELVDIRGADEVDALIVSTFEDSIYYYNYDDPAHGLVGLNFRNGNFRKDQTSVPIDSEYELFGWEDKMYYAQYDASKGKLFAHVLDFTDYSHEYFESSTGKRIENPVAYYPVNQYIVVESATDTGNILYVYDSTFVSSVDKIDQSGWFDFMVFPNPTDGSYYIQAPEERLHSGPFEIRFYDSAGDLIHTEKTDELDGTFKLNNQAAGVYFLQFLNNNKIIGHERLVLLEKN